MESDDRFEAACEGAYEAARALWLCSGDPTRKDSTVQLLAEVYAEILRAVDLAEELGIAELDRGPDGAVEAIRAPMSSGPDLPIS